MTSEPKRDRPTDSGWLPAVLAVFAVYFTLGLLFGRPESMGEVWFQRVASWLLAGPFWGSVLYFCTRFETEGRPNGRVIARWAAVITWVVVAIPLFWWTETNIEARLAAAEEVMHATEVRASQVAKHETPPVLGGGYGNVRGFVVDPSGEPIAGAQLFFSAHPQDKFVTTDERGAFESSGMPAGSIFILRAYRDGYHPWGGSAHTGEGLRIVLEPNAATAAAAPK
jgi:hypothetical protein